MGSPRARCAKTTTRYAYLADETLTIPRCTEGVNWYVLKTPIQITPAQLTAFEALYHDNARAVQALNGRQVLAK